LKTKGNSMAILQTTPTYQLVSAESVLISVKHDVEFAASDTTPASTVHGHILSDNGVSVLPKPATGSWYARNVGGRTSGEVIFTEV
jgi:hypothetical protein